jgi:hypothetical protein
MAPYDIASHFGAWAENLAYIGVGFCFGFILEQAGFSNSRKLAGQFYLYDMTVLKVMFTGIVVALVLTFWASGLQWLDFTRVFVNPTYLGSGILGGLLLGVGFIIGGFCPGTALIASATLKLDGMFFLGGLLAGIFIFGEVSPLFWRFYQDAGSLGRYTIPQWLHIDAGAAVLLIVVMALMMFTAGERLEAWAGARRARQSVAPQAAPIAQAQRSGPGSPLGEVR